MMDYMSIIEKSKLFYGLKESEITSLYDCFQFKREQYNKGSYVFLQGDKVSSIKLLLSGQVHIVKEDVWGKRVIVGEIGQGELFGESYALAKSQIIEVSAICVENHTELLDFKTEKLFTMCQRECEYHKTLIQNLISILAEKNRILSAKMEHMSRKTTREKVLSYLSGESQKFNSKVFTIPFDRQQMADYLSVDRSAMSKELSKMREDGILNFTKNKFELHD